MGRFLDIGKPTSSTWPILGLRIFASHLSSTRGRFSKLKDGFATHGAHLFFAHDDIDGGAPWRQSLLDALATMDALLAIHSPGFGASAYCNQEVGFAHGRGVPIVSLMDGEAPCGFISEAQGFPHREDDAATFIVKALSVIANRAPGRLSEATAGALKRADSYGRADKLTDQLLECETLAADALDDIDLAVRFNDQVYKSGNEPRLAKLAGKWGRQLWMPQQSSSRPHFAITDYDVFGHGGDDDPFKSPSGQ